jgi:hypothetical protein
MNNIFSNKENDRSKNQSPKGTENKQIYQK